MGVYKSVDGGKSWQDSSSGLSGDNSLSVNALIINPQNTSELLIATFGGLYKSENGGESWRKTSSSSSFDVEYVLDNPNTAYAPTNDGVLMSENFGGTWIQVGSGLPAGEGHGIGVDKTGNVIYAAVENKGLYVTRLTDISAKEPESKFGKNPYGFESFGSAGFGSGDSSLFIKILAAVVGVFVVFPVIIFIIRKRVKS